GQDYQHYTEIMEFLLKIRQQLPITIVMITHDMHLMLEYTDRTLVLTDGQLLMDDRPEAVLTNDQVCDRAYLKRTSLYDLAIKCDIEDPGDFVRCFIDDERNKDKNSSEIIK
ncbi:MAG: heme ABC transporter ATP-binding protein, partial [Butyrivibrio sp.]|nr:heme ABC transporter ATP-binding protein [Butyrivibrio sp.]